MLQINKEKTVIRPHPYNKPLFAKLLRLRPDLIIT
jgi:hypothetical protein